MKIKRADLLTLVVGISIFLSCLLSGSVFGAETIEDRVKRLEEKIKSLEEANKALDLKATRTQDVIDIENLQARYVAIHNTQESLAWMLFANRPDSSQEITHTRLVGFENIKKNYLGGTAELAELYKAGKLPAGNIIGWTPGGALPDNAPAAPGAAPRAAAGPDSGGIQHIHPIESPCVVVADDGKTAKATFTSLGFEGGWCYGMYANDYIKIDGKWYIWHMKWLRSFKTSYYKAWYDQTTDEVYEFTQGAKNADGTPKVNPGIDYSYLSAPGKVVKTITAPKPYKTWTKEDENGGWWKRDTVEP